MGLRLIEVIGPTADQTQTVSSVTHPRPAPARVPIERVARSWRRRCKGNPVNILIVDDSAVNLKLYARLVNKHRYGEPHCFTNSSQALDWAQSQEVALAIVDYNMPSPNGLEFISLFRSYPDKQQTPILMV